jgi:DNA helicase II / ATP-dependent DNA helicase PcrA
LNPLLDSLTDPQRAAVQHVNGPLMILAGPGSGKTRVVTHRIAYLLAQGIPDYNILALTFTNKAADEMRSRVENLVPASRVWTGTFHRFCARLLRQHGSLVGLAENFTIYDTNDSQRLLSDVLEDLELNGPHVTPGAVSHVISRAKNNGALPDQFQPRPGYLIEKVAAEAWPVYQQRLLQAAAVDFDDLLLHVFTLLKENPEVRADLDRRYRYVMVDEYQDTNLVQYGIVRALSLDHQNLAVTGDPDQSIYSWRGANLNNILTFESDYPEVFVVRLEQNYRSTQNILSVADRLISHNKFRKEKTLFTHNDTGQQVKVVLYPGHRDEADAIATRIAGDLQSGRRRAKDFAIFYRVNALSRVYEDALRRLGIPYKMLQSVEFYQRQEVKDLVAYLRLINNPRDEVALLRIINVPKRAIGDKTIERLRQYAIRERIPLLDAARQCGLATDIPARTATKIAKFVALYDRLSLLATAPVEEILGNVIELTEYAKQYEESENEQDADRLANIRELLTAANEFDNHMPEAGQLELFLEQVALVNEIDDADGGNDRVLLMTLHAAKGLEFPVVHIVAVEEKLLPHERSTSDPRQLEEERRLLFVGITRAMEELQLSMARQREFFGQKRYPVPSSFLMELSGDDVELIEIAPSYASAYQRIEPDSQHYEEETYINEFADESEEEPVIPSSPVSRATLPSPAATPRESSTTISTSLPLKTAAAMLAGQQAAANPISPDAFYQGMVVLHPQYQVGKIIALSGSGARRTATVAFATGGQKKFVLAQSPLRPASSK